MDAFYTLGENVAMVIYAHLSHLNEPPCGGSHQDLLETENSIMESQFTVAPKTSIVVQHIALQTPWNQGCAS